MRTLSLCLRASEAGLGLRRSTARTWWRGVLAWCPIKACAVHHLQRWLWSVSLSLCRAVDAEKNHHLAIREALSTFEWATFRWRCLSSRLSIVTDQNPSRSIEGE